MHRSRQYVEKVIYTFHCITGSQLTFIHAVDITSYHLTQLHLSVGADPNGEIQLPFYDFVYSPLWMATMTCKVGYVHSKDIVRLLLDSGANVTEDLRFAILPFTK